VPGDPLATFELFTRELALWWKPRPGRRVGLRGGVLFFEAPSSASTHALGRVCERVGDEVFEVGRILVWRPGECLRFEWRAPNFEAGEVTEVEVRFVAQGEGTRVGIAHHGWPTIPAARLRRDMDEASFESLIGLWWGDLLVALRHRAATDPWKGYQ
jgi:uncharacterized protein YndB with AHSA1/START domain